MLFRWKASFLKSPLLRIMYTYTSVAALGPTGKNFFSRPVSPFWSLFFIYNNTAVSHLENIPSKVNQTDSGRWCESLNILHGGSQNREKDEGKSNGRTTKNVNLHTKTQTHARTQWRWKKSKPVIVDHLLFTLALNLSFRDKDVEKKRRVCVRACISLSARAKHAQATHFRPAE